MRMVFLGPPGAGKGTQASRLIAHLGVPHVSTGEMLRRAIQADTPLGHIAAEYINDGRLVPDDVVLGMVSQRLGEPDCAVGCLLDGFPRTIPQATSLDEFFHHRDERLHLVLALAVPDEELIRRLLGRASVEHRDDDRQEAIVQRLAIYHRETEPLLAYYRQRGVLEEVSGVGTLDEVFQRISAVLDRRRPAA